MSRKVCHQVVAFTKIPVQGRQNPLYASYECRARSQTTSLVMKLVCSVALEQCTHILVLEVLDL